jgi:hypothetical protein
VGGAWEPKGDGVRPVLGPLGAPKGLLVWGCAGGFPNGLGDGWRLAAGVLRAEGWVGAPNGLLAGAPKGFAAGAPKGLAFGAAAPKGL